MMIQKIFTQKFLGSAALIIGMIVPTAAIAYVTPEEVLLSDDFFAPPRSRDAEEQVRAQSRISNERRAEEQESFFDAQEPFVPIEEVASEPEEEMLHGSADDALLDIYGSEELELIRTIRLLERVEARQDILELTGLHAGAPYSPNPLAPTGAGGIVTVLTMLGATGWTLKRAGKGKKVIVQE